MYILYNTFTSCVPLLTQTTVAGIIFLLSTGMTILITSAGAFILSYLSFLNHHSKKGLFTFLARGILRPIAESDTLWAANLSALISITLATLFYVSTTSSSL